jgi:forkhead transcription factor HCM1
LFHAYSWSTLPLARFDLTEASSSAMAATRRAPPLQIYQDAAGAFDQTSPHHDVEQAVYNALGPLSELSAGQQNVSLNAPYQQLPSSSGLSPPCLFKSSQLCSEIAKSVLNSIVIRPPQQQSHFTDSPQKKQMAPASSMQFSKRAMRPVAEPFPQFDKENIYTPEIMSNPAVSKPGLKRSFTDVAPFGDRGNGKKQRYNAPSSDGPVVLPDPDSLPHIEDDGNKPSFSYSQLIGMAILRAPNRRLTLAQIYKWISETFSFYRANEGGWQNSIRHNLSLNKAFAKQERPKDDPGKGNYWVIQPGFEAQFLKEKKRTGNYDSSFVYNASTSANRPSTAQSTSSGVPVSTSIDSAKFPEEPELSSDATIPASDPAIHDGVADSSLMPPPARALRSSPPPMDLRSSPPPVIVGVDDGDGTPPREQRFAVPSTRSGGGRKRKFAALHSGLGDSGYYSSIESSATRNPRILTSDVDADSHLRKRGRAEEEIARIRSSSYDSPSKNRLHPNVSSSPFRPLDSAPIPNAPLTPGVLFKKPLKPPASVSPNTNLKNHRNNVRKLLGSPDRSLGVWNNSPLPVALPNDSNFELWVGETFYDPFNESPLRPRSGFNPGKRSAKRARLERANTTAGILADITGVNVGRAKSHASLDKLLSSPSRYASPVKMSAPGRDSLVATPKLNKTLLPAPTEQDNDDFLFAVNLPSDESEPCVDILQGFQRIGANANANANASASASASAPAQPTISIDSPDKWPSLAPAPDLDFDFLGGLSPSKSPVASRKPRPGMGRSTTSFF